MEKITKGRSTRQFILTEARKVFNENGINLTIAELASKMGVTIGRITNHFHTKDHLFVGLSEDYEKNFDQILRQFSWNGQVNLSNLAKLLVKIMDLQYEYRSLMLFACSTGLSQVVMINQITAKWKQNLAGFTALISALVDARILDKRAREEKHFAMIRFQHINLLTTWLVSYTLYDIERPLPMSKEIYLKAILQGFYPYLTLKGKAEIKKILLSKKLFA